jgi:hypothetical protein
MKSLFKKTPNQNENHEIRRRIENRHAPMSPFGVQLNTLRPLIS